MVLRDYTPVKYMGLLSAEGLNRIRECTQRKELVGGVFTILWRNSPLIEPEYAGWYEAILDHLPAAQTFQLPSKPELLWRCRL
jgi:hypothetical protein